MDASLTTIEHKSKLIPNWINRGFNRM